MQERTPRHAEFFSPNLKTWVEVNLYPSSDCGLAVYFRDITDRKHAKEAFLNILQNITERKRAEAHLQARNEELEPFI